MSVEILYIKKINETYLHINCSESVRRELYDYFAFYAPNYKHMPRFKAKVWDGKIRLVSNNSLIYKGLFDLVLEFANKNGYKLESEWTPYNNSITREETELLFQKIQGIHTPKPIQVDFVHNCLKYQNCVILSPTSSGKSFAIYNLIRLLKGTGKGLLICPTINLVGQMFKDFAEYSAKNGWVVSDHVHMIYEGQVKYAADKPIYISTWQSLQTLGPKYFSQFDYVIVDEGHGSKAPVLKRIMERCVNAKFRVATTGTLDDFEANELVIQGLFGKIIRVSTTAEMIERGDAADLQINCMILNHPKSKAEQILGLDYHTEMDYLTTYQKRNNFIRKLVAGQKGNKLILFQFVEKHGKILYQDFKTHYPDKEVYYISGEVKMEERERIRERLSQTDDAILIASYGTYSTGMNVPSLRHVFSTMPGKAKIRILQTIGRVLRLSYGKTDAMFWDFADHVAKGKKVNTSYRHFEERLEIYMREGFKVKQYRIDIE